MKPNPPPLHRATSLSKRALQAGLLAVLTAGPSSVYIHAADTVATSSTAVVSGQVTNKTTGNGLIGAKVEVPAINATAFVDNTGRYLLNLPPGSYEIVVSYTGLDTERATVNLTAGHPA